MRTQLIDHLAYTLVALVMAGCGSSETDNPVASTGGSSPRDNEGSGGVNVGSGGKSASGGSENSNSGGASMGTGGATDPGCEDPGGGPVSEVVEFTSEDGKNLVGTLSFPERGTCLRSVLLLHQFSSDRGQWNDSVEAFVNAGFATFAIDIRGHGESDVQDGPLRDLLNDPAQTPLDVKAAYETLVAHSRTDRNRAAVVGTSIGANLSLVAMHQLSAPAAVALSPRMSAIEALASVSRNDLNVADLMCWAGELDGGGAQATTCDELRARASGMVRVEVLAGSSAHGVEIVDEGDTVSQAVQWLVDVL